MTHGIGTLLPSRQRSSTYYDWSVRVFPWLRNHYSQSHYYFLWAVIVDRLKKSEPNFILDIGCGPGQFANLLLDNGFTNYCGLDFSQRRIKLAQDLCPSFEFLVADIFTSDILEQKPYDTVIALEFLEHVQDDLQVLNRVREGTLILASVPNFQSPGHVRWFADEQDVFGRYQPLLSDLRIDSFLADVSGKKFFLLQGRGR